MNMRTLAPLILVIVAAAHLALGQSLAEVAEKEKERRETNDKEATVVVKNRGVWLVGKESNPEGDDSAKPVGDSESKRANKKEVDECRVSQDELEGLKRDQRQLETRLLQLRRKAQTARILDTHGSRELEADEWRVPRDEGTEILGELTSVRAGLDDTTNQIDFHLQRLVEDCQ